MTDTPTPAPADLAPEDRADAERQRGLTNAEFIAAARTAVPVLLSGVQFRDARIAELEAEAATLRQQRHDALKRVIEFELELDDRFEHSDHQSAKYYQRMRKAELREGEALRRAFELEEQMAARDAAIAEAISALEGESVAFGTTETNLYRSQRDAARGALHHFRAGADR
jgi:hypothetical protein